MEVVRDAAVIPIGRAQLRVLLATLLLEVGRTVPYERIVERLWGENPPASARSAVHTYVMRLRTTLGGGESVVRTRSGGYAIDVDPRCVDVTVFQELLARARDANAAGYGAAESALLTEALELWRGPALLDVRSESLRREVVPRLAEDRLQALERRIEVDLFLGRHAGLVGELGELTGAHPTRERLWALLMRALWHSGRQADALDTYRRVHRLFQTELGIDPGDQVRLLHQAILAGTSEAGVPGPAPVAGWVVPHQLPPDPGTFVRRAGPARQVLEALAEGGMPVVIVSGPPGVGKTALAVHVAHSVSAGYPDGQLYVDLKGRSVDTPLWPAVVLARFLRALGAGAGELPADLADQVGLYRSLVATRRVLVVLDNADSPEQVRPLLPGQPGCAVLVTSRDELGGLVVRDGGKPVSLSTMDADESRAVLARMLGEARVSAEPEAVTDIVAECAGLPLALRSIAADLHANPTTTIAAYAGALRVPGQPARLLSAVS